MKRKIVSVLMCATMTAALFAGCGGGGDTQASGDAAKTDDTAKTDDAASDDAADDAAADDAAGDDAAADNAGGSDGAITIGFAQVGHESDWRTASTKSCQDVFSAENGYDLQFVDCDNDSAAQIEAVRGFIQQAVDYIIIDPIVSTGWDTVLTECEDAGIPVIIIDRTIDDSDKYVSWVGSNFKTEGLAAGEWLKAYAENKGISEINALVIEGSTGASATIGRTEGFKEIADANGWTIVDSQSGDFTEAGGQEVMESYIKSYEGKFNVVICQNDNEAFGAMTAMKNAGIEYGVGKDVILVSFDACTAGLEKVMSGDINADFECNPLAAPDVEKVIKQLQAGETPEKEVYMTEHWYVNEDVLSSITVNGEEQALTVVTQEIIDAQY
ncbi:MAG: ABC transporter substrate-binding protein [Lachnospiraceae bacterium]|nr:ABC transporter substrate-binding protein [Lachnospiraceae bacterium]MDE6982238.1 ABC transporter substrate-binding protein [Lachnospiraceae bacterium]